MPRMKLCTHCGHRKGAHGHTINHAVSPWHPDRVTYYCEGECRCTRHSDEDPVPR